MTAPIKPWVGVAALHPDVLAENSSEDIFALNLGPLADGNPFSPCLVFAEQAPGRTVRGSVRGRASRRRMRP